MQNVEFEVVQIWSNDPYQPYTLNKVSDKSTMIYAIKIDNDYFYLGSKMNALYICDREEEK